VLELAWLGELDYEAPKIALVVENVKRARIVNTDLNLGKRPATANDIGPAAGSYEEDALHIVWGRVFWLQALFLDHFLELKP